MDEDMLREAMAMEQRRLHEEEKAREERQWEEMQEEAQRAAMTAGHRDEQGERDEPPVCEECDRPTTRSCKRCGARICRKCATDHRVHEYGTPAELWRKCK